MDARDARDRFFTDVGEEKSERLSSEWISE